MIKESIIQLVQGKSLPFIKAKQVFDDIFKGKVSNEQIAAFLVALALKGETELEITAAAKVVRANACKINLSLPKNAVVLDTCGTGGSKINKFNVSTAVAFVVSAAGIYVAKHGNRAMSSTSGSADVLEALGINSNVSPVIMQKAIEQVGIGFLFAPLYHPVLKEVALIRRQLGIKTIFNILGPLCNPAQVTHQLLGVSEECLVLSMAKVLVKLGVKKAFIVYGKDLKDEVSLSGETKAAIVSEGKIRQMVLTPKDFGLKQISVNKLKVYSVLESAEMIKEIFDGKKSSAYNIVLANASCALKLTGKVKTFKEGVCLSSALLEQGKVKEKFVSLKKFLEDKSNKK